MNLEEFDKLQEFIFNDEVQTTLSSINEKFMDFNILEITGMGSQEIKHSNILAWLFGDNEHNQQYCILERFLKKVSETNKEALLKHYIYLSEKNKQLTIYREKNNIDLLIVDENNHVVIAIENKVFANERLDGEDGGQLNKYDEFIRKNYENFKKYYIFLTVEHEDASNPKWMNANYRMISDSIIEILDSNNEISPKTKIIFESYIDTLKRMGVVKDDKVIELCKKIWDNTNYRQALEIIIANKPTKENELKQLLEQKATIVDTKLNSGVYNYFTRFDDKSPLIFRFVYSTKTNQLGIIIVTKEIFDDKFLEKLKRSIDNQTNFKINIRSEQFGYKRLTGYTLMCVENQISEQKISEIVNILKKIDDVYNQDFKG